MTARDASSRRALAQLITSFRVTSLIAAAADLGLADLLADGPRTSRDVALLARVDSDALHRVMRALAQVGILEVRGDGTFALTSLGECLRADAEGSLRSVARLYGRESIYRPFFDVVHTLSTGEPAFEHLFGMKLFEYLARHPEEASIFNDGMKGLTVQASSGVAAAYDFGSFGTLVDVGGGNGTLMITVLHAYPEPSGIIFDLAHARDGALEQIAAAGLTDRCTFVEGDFFKSFPTGADAYCLKWILHDWDDQDCITILRTCRRAMTSRSKLLVVERLIPTGNEASPEAIFGDINMLVLTGGRERTEAEFQALLEAADLRFVRTVPTATEFSVLEAIPL